MVARVLCFFVMAGLAKAAAIRVVVNNHSTASPSLVASAVAVAQRAFIASSVRMEWVLGFPKVTTATDIYVRLLPDQKTPSVIRVDACGSANPAGSVVWISVGCAMRLVASEHSVRVGQVLGYLIAHEVAHVLMVNEGHDDSGLMRSDWAKKELRDLQNGRLRFEFPKRIQQSAQEWIENRYRTAAGVDARF